MPGLLPSASLAQETQTLKTDLGSIEYVTPTSVSAEPKPTSKAKARRAAKTSFNRPWRGDSRRGRWRAIGIGTAGVATGFIAHELGHVFVNLAYGNVPTFEGLRYAGFIPFFRISPGISCNPAGCFHHDGTPFVGGRSGTYLITAAGFNVQNLGSEIILSLEPKIRYHRSPFQKGMLFFNISLSTGYALSAWFQIKPPIGDIYGMANASQLNPNWIALLVFIPAGLDLYRFFLPNSKWAPWVSRAAKVTFLGVSFAF